MMVVQWGFCSWSLCWQPGVHSVKRLHESVKWSCSLTLVPTLKFERFGCNIMVPMYTWLQMYVKCAQPYIACVASISNRVTAWKLEWEQKRKVEGGGGGEKRKRLPANPTILKNAPWYFTVRLICKLTARQIEELLCSLIEHVPGDCKNCNKKGLW